MRHCAVITAMEEIIRNARVSHVKSDRPDKRRRAQLYFMRDFIIAHSLGVAELRAFKYFI